MLTPIQKPSLESQQIDAGKLAWIMGVSLRTVRTWCEEREIEHFRVGHVIRFAPDQVLAFIVSNTRRRKAAPESSPAAGARLGAEEWARIERLIEATIAARMTKEAA